MSRMLCILCAAPASDDAIQVDVEVSFPSLVIPGLHPRGRRWRKRPVGVFADAVTHVGQASENSFYVDKVATNRPVDQDVDGYESDDGEENIAGGTDAAGPDEELWITPTSCGFDVGNMGCGASIAHDTCLRLAAAWCGIASGKRHHVFRDSHGRFGIRTGQVSCALSSSMDGEWTSEHPLCLAVFEPEMQEGMGDRRCKIFAADATGLLCINYGDSLLDMVSSNADWVHESPGDDMHFFRPDTFPALKTIKHRADGAERRSGMLCQLQLDVLLLILRRLIVVTGSITSDIADISRQLGTSPLLNLALSSRFLRGLIRGSSTGSQVWLPQCKELGWLPTEADKTKSSHAVRAALTAGSCDWMAYYCACVGSPNMIKRVYLHERVADIRRLAHESDQYL